MSKYQALIDALEAPGLSDCPWVAFGPSNGAAPPDYYNEVVAVRGDAQVQVICHAPRGLDGACTADTTYIAEANPTTIRALLADLERAEKEIAALAQQAQEPVAAALGDIVALWDKYAPSEYMMAIHMQAKRALAGQQPVSPDMHGWCAYVGGMVACWITSEPDAHARLGDDKFDAAIAGIIERRLWAMPTRDTTPPAPQVPAPVDELAEFEASMREKHGWVARDFQSDSFGYFDGHTATAWLAWQARAALQSPSPQTKGGE